MGTYENLGETRARGVEASGEWRPSPHLRVLPSYTFQNSEAAEDASTDQPAPGMELRRRPRHQGSLTAEATLGRATLAATLVASGRLC